MFNRILRHCRAQSLFPGHVKLFNKLGALLLFCLAIFFLVHGCATHKRYEIDPKWRGYTEKGKASYYAMKFQFRRTASGERFNNFSLSAAHKSLSFGTRVRVTNIRNGKYVTVRINDRGPYVKGRIIDLTREAFAKIENLDRGIAEVAIKVVQ